MSNEKNRNTTPIAPNTALPAEWPDLDNTIPAPATSTRASDYEADEDAFDLRDLAQGLAEVCVTRRIMGKTLVALRVSRIPVTRSQEGKFEVLFKDNTVITFKESCVSRVAPLRVTMEMEV